MIKALAIMTLSIVLSFFVATTIVSAQTTTTTPSPTTTMSPSPTTTQTPGAPNTGFGK